MDDRWLALWFLSSRPWMANHPMDNWIFTMVLLLIPCLAEEVYSNPPLGRGGSLEQRHNVSTDPWAEKAPLNNANVSSNPSSRFLHLLPLSVRFWCPAVLSDAFAFNYRMTRRYSLRERWGDNFYSIPSRTFSFRDEHILSSHVIYKPFWAWRKQIVLDPLGMRNERSTLLTFKFSELQAWSIQAYCNR